MRVLIEDLLNGKKFELGGSDLEVERALRSHFPGLGIEPGDVGAYLFELARTRHIHVQVLEGPVPAPHAPPDDGQSWGMHRGDDPWPREADMYREPGSPVVPLATPDEQFDAVDDDSLEPVR